MPLTRLVREHQHAVRAFVYSTQSNLMILSATQEVAQFWHKIVASLQDDPCNRAMFFAHSADFASRHDFLKGAMQAMQANLQDVESALAKQGIPHGAPAAWNPDLAATQPEVAFTEFVERFRAAFDETCAQLVLIFHAGHFRDHEAFVTFMRHLAAVAPVKSVKYICLLEAVFLADPQGTQKAEPRQTPRRAPSWISSDLESQRTVLLELRNSRGPLEAIKRFMNSPSMRVMIAPAAPIVRTTLTSLAKGGLAPAETGALDTLTLTGRGMVAWATQLAEGTLAALTPLIASRAVPPSTDKGTGRAYQLASEMIESVPSSARVTLVLDASEIDSADSKTDLAAFIQRLEDGARSRQLRLIVLLHPEFMPRTLSRPVAWREFSIGRDDIERGLNEKVDDPDTPDLERMRYLAGLASIATTDKKFDLAINLHKRVIALAQQTDNPQEIALAHLELGDTLYAMREWDTAEKAYATALDKALQVRFEGGIAMGLSKLGHTYLRAKKHQDATQAYLASAQWFDQMGDRINAAYNLVWLGEVRRLQRDTRGAAQSWNEALRRFDAVQPELRDSVQSSRDEVVERLARLQDEASKSHMAKVTRQQLKTKAYVPEHP